eukprot:scaffold3052_cov389-Prasinococcus_capsulatus_cf.AAC.15
MAAQGVGVPPRAPRLPTFRSQPTRLCRPYHARSIRRGRLHVRADMERRADAWLFGGYKEDAPSTKSETSRKESSSEGPANSILVRSWHLAHTPSQLGAGAVVCCRPGTCMKADAFGLTCRCSGQGA